MLFCWGDSSRGQLPVRRPGGNVITTPTSVNFHEQLVQICCGEEHTLFLTVTGQVLSCGRNSKGQLGRSRSKDTNLPVKIEGLSAVAAIACGQDHSLALCDSGQVFSWGAGGEGQLGHTSMVAKCLKPMPIHIALPFQIPVVQVACGNVHSLALTKGGEVLSWGQNSYGQLGLGKQVKLQPAPDLIRSLVGVPIIQISAGGAHTLALALHGQVFCCGANSVGQLGLNRTDVNGRFAVCAVPALRTLGVSSISCGEAHTAVLTKAGEVHTFGEGAHGQLGHNTTNNELKPRKVEGIDGPAKQVTCGSHHTLVLLSSGIVFTFGCDVQAQASGGTTNSPQPVRLEGDWNSTEAGIHTEIKISSGYKSNFLFSPHSKTNILGEPIGKLEEVQVQRWVSMLECERNIKEIKREICWTFATSSNIVACFIEDRNTPGTIQIDLNFASQTFDQLLGVPWIKNSMDMTHVVNFLVYAGKAMKCPEIFLLLPMCSMFHEQQNVITLVLPLALAITDLSEPVTKSLKEHWSSMDTKIMMKNISMWKQALAFLLKSSVWGNYAPGVKAVLDVLKLLYKVNKRAVNSRKVPLSEFYIEEIGTTPGLLEGDVMLWNNIKRGLLKEEELNPCLIFCHYPFLMDLKTKISIFRYIANVTQKAHEFAHNGAVMGGLFGEMCNREAPTPILQLKVRRTALIEDTFRQLNHADHDNFKKTLVVLFVDDAKLTDVTKRDFFLHVFNELLAPKSEMFMYNDSKTMIWFPAKPTLELKQYFLFGILCGLALYNNNIVHMPFPLALFKKLINVKPTLEDMKEFTSVIGKSLHCILHEYPDDVVDDLNIPFCVHWDGADVELVSEETSVTKDNKKKFVDTYVDYALNKSVEQVFNEFKRGFYKVCDEDVVKFFQPEELRGVMVGTEEYDWDTFKQNTAYFGQYHERHPTIIAFWEVFEELTHDQKKAFLLFLTGCDRVPILGMDQVRMTMLERPNFTQDHLPESLTCHSHFMLPPYENKEQLKAKLIEAINHNRGFWIEDTVTE